MRNWIQQKTATLLAILAIGPALATLVTCGDSGQDCAADGTCVEMSAGLAVAQDAIAFEPVVTEQTCTDNWDCVEPPSPYCDGDGLVTYAYPGSCVASLGADDQPEQTCTYQSRLSACVNCPTSCLPSCLSGDGQRICDPRDTGGCATVGFCQRRDRCGFEGPAGHEGLPCYRGNSCEVGGTCTMAGTDGTSVGALCTGATDLSVGVACAPEQGRCELGDDGALACMAFCGDGAVNSELELCDDGNNEDGDGCSSTCEIETGWQCAGGAPVRCEVLTKFGCVSDDCALAELYRQRRPRRDPPGGGLVIQ